MSTQQEPGIGHNVDQVNFMQDERNRLQQEYGYLEKNTLDLVAQSKPITEITDQAGKDVVKGLIKQMRDMYKRLSGVHEAEKAPHLERGRGTDGFFFPLMEKLGRRDKRGLPGEGERLNELLTAYDTRILREEEERRRQEAARLQREADERAEQERKAREEQARLQREADELAAAAERARKPENIAAKTEQAEQTQEQANQAGMEVVTVAVEAELAQGAAQQAFVETLARPADIMRNRGEDGILSTMKRENYSEVVDATKLNKEMLWPFISLEAKQKALNMWAKTTGYNQQMEGAAIGNRPKSVVR